MPHLLALNPTCPLAALQCVPAELLEETDIGTATTSLCRPASKQASQPACSTCTLAAPHRDGRDQPGDHHRRSGPKAPTTPAADIPTAKLIGIGTLLGLPIATFDANPLACSATVKVPRASSPTLPPLPDKTFRYLTPNLALPACATARHCYHLHSYRRHLPHRSHRLRPADHAAVDSPRCRRLAAVPHNGAHYSAAAPRCPTDQHPSRPDQPHRRLSCSNDFQRRWP